jgi:hypothetical protein
VNPEVLGEENVAVDEVRGGFRWWRRDQHEGAASLAINGKGIKYLDLSKVPISHTSLSCPSGGPSTQQEVNFDVVAHW